MVATTLSEQGTAKLKFFAVYLLAVVLLACLIAYLWRGDNNVVSAKQEITAPVAEESNYKQVDKFLHQRLQNLDDLYSGVLNGNGNFFTTIMPAQNSLNASLDSVEKATPGGRAAEKKELSTLVTNFRKTLQSRTALMASYMQLHADTSKPSGNETDLAALKKMLAEKDKKIATLQNQVAEQPVAAAPSTGTDDEWKQKYMAMKSRHTELNTAYNTLSSSYQTVVADNRRLISQLQMARKQ